MNPLVNATRARFSSYVDPPGGTWAHARFGASFGHLQDFQLFLSANQQLAIHQGKRSPVVSRLENYGARQRFEGRGVGLN